MIMMRVVSLCFAVTVFLFSIFYAPVHATYEIGNFNVSLTNPAFPDHIFPVYVFYPIERAPTASRSTAFPTLVFAHGFACDASFYFWVHQQAVPRGVIVAYIDSFPVVGMNITQFAIDQRYTLQWLQTVVNHNGSSPIYKQINVAKSMAAGHSAGGGATLSTMGDPYIEELFNAGYRFTSLFTMAPCGGSATAGFAENIPSDIPAFVFTGTLDCICPSIEAHTLYKHIPPANCKYYADLVNATHCQWLSAPEKLENACERLEDDICDAVHPSDHDQISLSEQLSVAADYLRLWINATVLDSGLDNDGYKHLDAQLKLDQNTNVLSIVHQTTACCAIESLATFHTNY